MDSKEAFVLEIEKLGYDVENDVGIIMALVPEHDYKNPMTHIAISNAAERVGYRASRGMKMIQKKENLDV